MQKAFVSCLVFILLLATGVAMAQQTAPAPAAPAASSPSLHITRMEIAASVENREPVGIAATFPATTEKVSCFLEFKDVAQETRVNVVWTLGLNEMGTVSLTIKPYAKFRTWSNKTLAGMKGDWKVEVKDEAGNVLRTATFKVE